MVDSIWTRSLECHHVCQLMLHHGQHSSRSAVVPRFITPFLQPPQEISEVLVIAIGTHFDVRVIEAHSGRFLPAQLPADVIHVCFANRMGEQLVTFSPDGGRLAVACNSGLYIVEPIVGPIHRVLPSHRFHAMVFSPCGAHIAVWDDDNDLMFLQSARTNVGSQYVLQAARTNVGNQILVQMETIVLNMFSMAYAPNGASLAAVGGNESGAGHAVIYSITLQQFSHFLSFTGNIFAAVYSPSSAFLVLRPPLGVLHVEVDSGSNGIILQSTRIDCIVYTPSGEYLTAISRGSVIIIEAGSMEVLYSVQLLDFEFERKSSLVSLVYTSRRIACGRLEDEIGWGASWELLASCEDEFWGRLSLMCS